MNESPTKEMGLLRRMWNRFVKNWVGEFDEEMAACELNCRELDCDLERWEKCENRLQYMARIKEYRRKVEAGELFQAALDRQNQGPLQAELPESETGETKHAH